jgi:hypothetical protein
MTGICNNYCALETNATPGFGYDTSWDVSLHPRNKCLQRDTRPTYSQVTCKWPDKKWRKFVVNPCKKLRKGQTRLGLVCLRKVWWMNAKIQFLNYKKSMKDGAVVYWDDKRRNLSSYSNSYNVGQKMRSVSYDNLEVAQAQNVLCSAGKGLAKPRSSELASANQCQYCNKDFNIQLYEPCGSLLRLLQSLDMFLELRHAQWIPTTTIF